MITNFSKKLKQIGLTEYPKLLFTRGLKGIRLGKKDASEGSSSKTESCLKFPRVTQCAPHKAAWNDPQQQLEGELLDTVEFIGKTLRDLACSLHQNNEEMLEIVKQSTVSPANKSRSPCSFNWDSTCAKQCPRRGCTTVGVPSDRCLTTLTPTSLQTTEENSASKGHLNCAARNRPKELTSDEFCEIRQLLENLGQEFCAQNKQINEMLSANACRQSAELCVPEIEPIMQRLDQVRVEIMEMKQRGDIKTESGCPPHPLETALACTLGQLNAGLTTLGQSLCEILSKLEHIHGKIATPDPPPEMPMTLPEEAICAPETGEANLDAALCELKTRVQNLEEQNGVTLQALAGLQKGRPDSRAEFSISGTQLATPSLPESASPYSVSSRIPEAMFKEAGVGNDPAVLETLGELKSLLQVLGRELDVIANYRKSPECSVCGHRKTSKVTSTDICADGSTAQLLEDLRCGVLSLVGGFRRMAACGGGGGACGPKIISKPRKSSAIPKHCPCPPPAPRPVDALRGLKSSIQALNEEFCKFQNRGVSQSRKGSSPLCRPSNIASRKSKVVCECCSPQRKSHNCGITKRKRQPSPTGSSFAVSIAPLRPQLVAYPERFASGKKSSACWKMEGGRPHWKSVPLTAPRPSAGSRQAQVHGEVLDRLPSARPMTANAGQSRASSARMSALDAEATRESSVSTPSTGTSVLLTPPPSRLSTAMRQSQVYNEVDDALEGLPRTSGMTASTEQKRASSNRMSSPATDANRESSVSTPSTGTPVFFTPRPPAASRQPELDDALKGLPRVSVTTTTNARQSRASSVRKSSLGTGFKRTSSALTPSAPTNTPVSEEVEEMEAEDGGGGGAGTDSNANFNFPAGAKARQKSNPRLKWIPLTPVGCESRQAPMQRLSEKKPEWKGFRIGYKKTRTLRR